MKVGGDALWQKEQGFDSQMDLAFKSNSAASSLGHLRHVNSPLWASISSTIKRGLKKKATSPPLLLCGCKDTRHTQEANTQWHGNITLFFQDVLTLKYLPLHKQRKHWKICHWNGQGEIPALLSLYEKRREVQAFLHRIKNKSGWGVRTYSGMDSTVRECYQNGWDTLALWSALERKKERERRIWSVT